MQAKLRENKARFEAQRFIYSHAKHEVTSKESVVISGTKLNVLHRPGYTANYW